MISLLTNIFSSRYLFSSGASEIMHCVYYVAWKPTKNVTYRLHVYSGECLKDDDVDNVGGGNDECEDDADYYYYYCND